MPTPLAFSLFQLPDPVEAAMHLFTGLLTHLLDGARTDIGSILDRYLFITVDPTAPGDRPLTANPALRGMTTGLMVAADTLLTGLFTFACFRSVLDRSMRSKYQMRWVIPRVLLAVALVHSSLLFAQLLIDLNNALGEVARTLGGGMSTDNLPWSSTLSTDSVQHLRLTDDLFHCIFDVALVIALVILGMAYVIRSALLDVLIVVAPLAALCMVLLETRGYARLWTRLFLTTVFMQAVQLLVLRVASVTALNRESGVASSIYGIAILYILLKVPGALNTAAHLETKAKTMGHNLERSMRRALGHGHPARRPAS